MATQHVRRSALADAVPVSQARILGDRIRDRARDRVSFPMVGKGRVVRCVPGAPVLHFPSRNPNSKDVENVLR